MTELGKQIRDSLVEMMDAAAKVRVTERAASTTVHFRSLFSDTTVDVTIPHRPLYEGEADQWGLLLRRDFALMARGPRVDIGFKGKREDVSNLLQKLFDGEIRDGKCHVMDCGATIRAWEDDPTLSQSAISMTTVFVHTRADVERFVHALYAAWMLCGQKNISVKVDHEFTKLEPGKLEEAILRGAESNGKFSES